MSGERMVGEIAFDSAYRNLYLGIREEDGHMGTIIAFADDAEYVHAAIRVDQRARPAGTKYYLFKPQEEKNRRESWAIGGNQDACN